MKIYNCVSCSRAYGPRDDVMEDRGLDSHRDADWHPENGRCYTCDMHLCYDIFGGLMEPDFELMCVRDGRLEFKEAEDFPDLPHGSDHDDIPF